jgi:hypothetical protein
MNGRLFLPYGPAPVGKLKAILPSLPGVRQDHEEAIIETELIEQALVIYRPFKLQRPALAEMMMRSRGRCFTRSSTEGTSLVRYGGPLLAFRSVVGDVRLKREGNPVPCDRS